jgi:hypothetical protein
MPRADGHVWVPVDDEHTHVYNWMCAYDESVQFTPEWIESREAAMGRGQNDLLPGTFVLKRNPSNDYLIDRQMQKTRNFTGIVGVNTQDFALQEGMGPICDRSKEFLGSSDKAVIAMRRLLLDALDTSEKGGVPRGADALSHRMVRPYDHIVPPEQDWRTIFDKELLAKW